MNDFNLVFYYFGMLKLGFLFEMMNIKKKIIVP